MRVERTVRNFVFLILRKTCSACKLWPSSSASGGGTIHFHFVWNKPFAAPHTVKRPKRVSFDELLLPLTGTTTIFLFNNVLLFGQIPYCWRNVRFGNWTNFCLYSIKGGYYAKEKEKRSLCMFLGGNRIVLDLLATCKRMCEINDDRLGTKNSQSSWHCAGGLLLLFLHSFHRHEIVSN